MYDDHLRLIGKHVLDVLLVFFGFFSLGVMAEALRVNIGSKSAISLQWRPVDPKFQVEGVAPTNHCSSQKTRLTDLSWCKSLDRSFFHLVTIHAFDRRTDGRTEFSSLDRVCSPCSTVKRKSVPLANVGSDAVAVQWNTCRSWMGGCINLMEEVSSEMCKSSIHR